ncbi:MAG: ABC transporter permease subunit [Verrucomicrobiota bacterium]
MGGSLGRIWVLAGATFTQLVRMKTFYFLLIFCALVALAGSLNIMAYNAEQQMKLVKDVSLGAMSLFASIFGIVATAMLIPRDMEDRTLYTILAKPVPRVEYLIGKLLGVLMVIGVSLAAMHLFFSGVLYARQEMLLADDMTMMADRVDLTEEDVQSYAERVREQGVTWNLVNATGAIFLKACVVTASAMVISTVATTSLFTIIVSVLVFFIGHVQALARTYWVDVEGGGVVAKLFSALVALVFPDYQLYNVIDGVVSGEWIPFGAMLKLVGLTAFYVGIYTVVAYLVFAEKEL